MPLLDSTPSKVSTNSKPLRFALWIRVSTEAQEKQGESLGVQRKNNTRDIERLGGTIAEEYGGQEHATAGWERKEFDRLLADAAKGKFDAVIVYDPSRWSRDNAKSAEGLEVLKRHGIKFYVGSVVKDLYEPNVKMELGLHSVVGQYVADISTKKSAESRIERAKRGVPTGGYLPFGRTYDKKTGKWDIDPEKQAMIVDMAKRYLKGESLVEICKEYGWAYSNIFKVLRERSGEVWVQEFNYPRLNIHEKIPTKVPRLLDEKTIKDLKRKMYDNKTSKHGRPKPGRYLLGGYVFCSECGYNMVGQPGDGRLNSRFYYRHAHHEQGMKCPLTPKPWVPTTTIEDAVIRDLFNLFGNPTAIVKAVRDAVPNCDDALKRQRRLQEDLERVEKGKARVLSLVAKGLVSDKEAESELESLKERQDLLIGELSELQEVLADVPDEEAVKCYFERIEGATGSMPHVLVYDEQGNQNYEGGNTISTFLRMSWEDKRRLVEAVFERPLAGGKPAGVYVLPGEVKPHRPKKWEFRIRGILEFESVMQSFWSSPRGMQTELNSPENPGFPTPPFVLNGVA